MWHHRPINIALAIWATIGVLGTHNLHAADNLPMPTAPCTKRETWNFGGKINGAWIKRFNDSLQSPGAAAASLTLAVSLYQRSTAPEVKAFGQYWTGRLAYTAKLPHLAARLFNRVLEDNTDKTLGVRAGALECLNVIQERHPTLHPADGALDRFTGMGMNLPEPQRSYLRDAAIYSAKHRLATSDGAVPLSTELKLATGSNTHDVVITILKASHDQNEEELAAIAEKLVPSFEPPSRFKNDASLLALSLARGLYGRGKFQKSIDVYKRVKNSSNLVSTAITERAWASLVQDRTAEAIGTSSNLIVGGLKKTFAPEAFAVAVIALTETCNYPQAIELIKAFRRTYGPAYKWLYDWRATPGFDRASMYPLLTGFLKKKGNIPERIGLEWIRSPVFAAYQEELNAVLEQKNLINRVWGKSVSALRQNDRKSMAGPIQGVKLLLGGFLKEIGPLEAALVQKINLHLLNRNRSMLTYLADVSENIQRAEVEVFNALGEKLIVDNARGGAAKAVDNSRDRKKGEEGPVWDWGKFPTSTDEEAEIWEDELGFLKADLKSRCSR